MAILRCTSGSTIKYADIYLTGTHLECLVTLSKEEELSRAQSVVIGYVVRFESNVAFAGAEGEDRHPEHSRQEEQRYQCSRVHISAAGQECMVPLQRERATFVAVRTDIMVHIKFKEKEVSGR